MLILRSDRVGHRHFVAPTVVPGIAIGFILALLIQRAANNPEYFLYAAGWS